MIYVIFLLLASLLALSVYTLFRSREIRSAFKPDGQFVTADDVRLHFHRVPAASGPSEKDHVSLVFLHGASGNAYDQLEAFRPALEGRYDLIFFDRPGLGFSERSSDRQADPAEQARLIGLGLDALNVKQAVVIGHSLGASVASALALVRPDLVQGLVYVTPATHPWPGGVNWYYNVAALPVIGRIFCATITLPVAERVAPKAILGVFSPEEAPEGYAGKIRLPLLFLPVSFRANALDVMRLKAHVARLSRRYGEIEAPAVVITGTRDQVVWPSIHSDGLVRDLQNARLVVLNGAGHMPHHTRTEDIVAEIDTLIRQIRQETCLGSLPALEDTAAGQ